MRGARIYQARGTSVYKLKRLPGSLIRQTQNGNIRRGQAIAARRLVFALEGIDFEQFEISSADKAFSNLQSGSAFLAVYEYFRRLQGILSLRSAANCATNDCGLPPGRTSPILGSSDQYLRKRLWRRCQQPKVRSSVASGGSIEIVAGPLPRCKCSAYSTEHLSQM